ncbi:LMxysn_1693 family intestinal colonization protein [Listeria aquatica]|uniref:LMxysn_1693 family intestinal colonization protein n=1 Tax=Listeria aquatica TaxID=1494960 RepID=UPI003F71C02E
MKKKCIVSMLVGTLIISVTFPTTTIAFAENAQSNDVYVNTQIEEPISSESPIVFLQDYTVTDENGKLIQEKPINPFLREATGFHYKTVSQSIKKGSRTYLGVKTYKKGANFKVRFKLGPVFVSLGGNASKSGKYKEYRQKVKITVKVKKYENGSGRYVGTYTYTSNTSYIDRVPV